MSTRRSVSRDPGSTPAAPRFAAGQVAVIRGNAGSAGYQSA